MTPTLTDDVEIDNHPEEQGETESPYGPNNEKLPKQLIDIATELVRDIQKQDGYHKWLRRQEVMRSWKNRLYDRGIQHVYWTGRGDGAGFAAVTAGGLTTNSAGNQVQAPRFCDDYNFFGEYVSILTAVQTQDDPDIAFRPKNAARAEDIDAAKEAEGYRDVFDENNNINDIDVRIFRALCLDARVVAWTRTVTDPQRFGYDQDGDPRTMQTTDIYGTLESRVPIMAKGQENCHYCGLVDDLDYRVLRAAYPEFRKEIKEGEKAIGESGFERLARLGVMQNNAGGSRGSIFSNLSARANWWLRPSNYEDDMMDAALDEPIEGAQTVREAFQKLFPMGIHLTFVGEVYVGSWAESMDDALKIVGGAKSQDGMFQTALADPIVITTDALNDALNTAREIWDVGWPSTWWSAETTEYDAANAQRAEPYALRQLLDLKQGERAADKFYREPDPAVPPSFQEYIQQMSGPIPQFLMAALPSLFGGETKDNDTASGQAQAKNQALGTQGQTFRVKEEIWAAIYYQAALAAAKAPPSDDMVVSGKGGTTRKLDISKLTKGKFGAYPDRDSGFPESTQAKRQIMQNWVQLAAQSPIGNQILDAPSNAKLILSLNGIDGMVVPEAESHDKQLTEIEELLQNAPIPPDPIEVLEQQQQHATQVLQAQAAGQPFQMPFQPPPAKSTITPDPLDFHGWEFNFCQDWLSSADCRTQLSLGNQDGVANVRAHAMEHWALKGQVPWEQEATAMPASLPAPPMPPQTPGLGPPKAPAAPTII